MAEEQKVGRNEKIMSAIENFDKAKVLFDEVIIFLEGDINEAPTNEAEIKDVFEKIKAAMFDSLEEMGKLLNLPKEFVLSKRQ